MSFVLKYPTSRYWIASFYDANGRLRRRSTRETNRNRALEVARIFEKAAKGSGSPQRIRQIFSEFYREHYGEDLPFTSFRKYASEWLTARKAEISPGTHRRYGDAVSKFLSFLGPKADRGLDEIGKAQISAFRDAQLASSAPATTNHCLKIIKMIFRSARRDRFLLEDPADGIKTVKNCGSFERRPFSIDELRAVLAVANEEWQSLIKFGLYTGQRLGDLAALTWSQIDLQRNEIRLTTRKTGKALLIPIATPLREHLLSLASGDNPRSPVHPRAFEIVAAQNGRVGQLSNQFSELLVACGLRKPQAHRSKGIGRGGKRTGIELSFHSLRHTAVSLLKDAGVPDAVVMALAGHESAAMSQRYTHVGKEALSRAAETLPEL
jgi:integrase